MTGAGAGVGIVAGGAGAAMATLGVLGPDVPRVGAGAVADWFGGGVTGTFSAGLLTDNAASLAGTVAGSTGLAFTNSLGVSLGVCLPGSGLVGVGSGFGFSRLSGAKALAKVAEVLFGGGTATVADFTGPPFATGTALGIFFG